jgi:centromere protein C
VDDSTMVDTDEEDIDTSGFADDSFASKLAKKGGKRGKVYVDDAFGSYEDAGEDEDMDLDDESDDDNTGTRRSRRATKGKKMAWWKGERAIYNKGNMVGLLTAIPTPQNEKKRVGSRKLSKKDRKSVKKALHDSDSDEAEADLSGGGRVTKKIKKEGPIDLPDDVNFLPRGESDEVSIWDDATDTSKALKVVCYEETLQPPSALPVTAKRPPGKDKVGSAAQSFNVPEIPKQMSGWISGFVELPPQAIKDAEGVGECAQVFFISECQDGALELGIADPKEPEWQDETAQRQLLNKGDSFFVPPGNIYRLENHSYSTACTIFWTIVKPIENGEE